MQTLGRVLSPIVVAGLRVFGTGPLVGLATAGFGPERAAEATLIAAATAGTNRDDAVRVWLGLGGHDLRGRLSEVSAPTLVLAGERDRGRGGADELARLVPGARLAVIPGAAHNSNLHAPDAFTAALSAFLDEVEAASPSPPWTAPDPGP
jgi:3-oxoadipate enol-lactonase